MTTFKRHSIFLILAFIGVCGVLLMHLGNPDSFLFEETLTKIVNYHKCEPTFARRILTTQLIDFFHENFQFNYLKSFVVVNFLSLGVVGYLIGKISYRITNDLMASSIAIVSFYLSFSILFAFYQPIYTYDEPLQYLFFFLALYSIMVKRLFISLFFFLLSICVRETTLLLLPGFLLFFSDQLDQLKLNLGGIISLYRYGQLF